MNKTRPSNILIVLLVSIIIVLSTGCGVEKSTSTPTSQFLINVPLAPATNSARPPTVAPPYIHYTPSRGFNIHLRFDYPGSWVFSEQKRVGDLMILGLDDPRFLTLPTLSLDDFHPVPNDFASIYIWIYPVENGRTLDTEIRAFRQGSDGISWRTFLDEYKVAVGGYNASVLEYQDNDSEKFSSLMFERSIFFIAEDQIYEIFFTIAEKDRNSEFERGYEYFFNSLKVVP